jgi:hypothetical protein
MMICCVQTLMAENSATMIATVANSSYVGVIGDYLQLTRAGTSTFMSLILHARASGSYSLDIRVVNSPLSFSILIQAIPCRQGTFASGINTDMNTASAMSANSNVYLCYLVYA